MIHISSTKSLHFAVKKAIDNNKHVLQFFSNFHIFRLLAIVWHIPSSVTLTVLRNWKSTNLILFVLISSPTYRCWRGHIHDHNEITVENSLLSVDLCVWMYDHVDKAQRSECFFCDHVDKAQRSECFLNLTFECC